jgi:8-oxo-dGTP diphosphatase
MDQHDRGRDGQSRSTSCTGQASTAADGTADDVRRVAVSRHQACAGAIIFDAAGRLLLIQRGRPPSQASWSVPGGRCRPDETAQDACVREVAEETGLAVSVLRPAGYVERDGLDGCVYDIDDFVCAVVGGALQAGDDADEARWVRRDELVGLSLAPGLLDTLTAWHLMPS